MWTYGDFTFMQPIFYVTLIYTHFLYKVVIPLLLLSPWTLVEELLHSAVRQMICWVMTNHDLKFLTEACKPLRPKEP